MLKYLLSVIFIFGFHTYSQAQLLITDKLELLEQSRIYREKAVDSLLLLESKLTWYIPDPTKRDHIKALIAASIASTQVPTPQAKLLGVGLAYIGSLATEVYDNFCEMRLLLAKAAADFEMSEYCKQLSLGVKKDPEKEIRRKTKEIKEKTSDKDLTDLPPKESPEFHRGLGGSVGYVRPLPEHLKVKGFKEEKKYTVNQGHWFNPQKEVKGEFSNASRNKIIDIGTSYFLNAIDYITLADMLTSCIEDHWLRVAISEEISYHREALMAEHNSNPAIMSKNLKERAHIFLENVGELLADCNDVALKQEIEGAARLSYTSLLRAEKEWKIK